MNQDEIEIKKLADEIVKRFKEVYTTKGIYTVSDMLATRYAMESTENTIVVMKGIEASCDNVFHEALLAIRINDQKELLTELKSRL